MARDRQRAKQRRARRAGGPKAEGAAGAGGAGGPDLDRLHRENVPGELDHVSANVDQFEAALIAGSGGEPVEADVEAEPDLDADLDEALPADVELEAEAGADPAATPAVARPARAAEAPKGNRTMAFLRASWAELQRVQWPDRRQVAQATAVVLGFVIVAGAYLGLADAIAQRIVDFIL